MAENQFKNRPSVMDSIHAYMQGGPAPPNPETFTMEAQKADYIEMLARLLGEEKFKELVPKWNIDKNTGKPIPGAYNANSEYDAAYRRSLGVPSYIDTGQMAGRTYGY